MSRYDDRPGTKFNGAAQFIYRGALLRGSPEWHGYYSDGYFPGSRKGRSLFTGVSKRLKSDWYLSGSIGYNLRHLSRTGILLLSLENTYAECIVLITTSRAILHVVLLSPSGRALLILCFVPPEGRKKPSANAVHRLGGQWRWQSSNAKHSLLGSLEGGTFTDPAGYRQAVSGKSEPQLFVARVYGERFVLKGAFYLYEQMMANRQGSSFTGLPPRHPLIRISQKANFSSA